MTHNNHIQDGINKDEQYKNIYLDFLKGWEDPYPEPVINTYENVRVVRDDLLVGTKCRGADALLSQVKEDTIVYVQPRVGLAGVSILDVAKRHNKNVILFMPSSKKISDHQACCIERGAKPIFHRIAAMPNLNKIAKKYAEDNGHYFVPLGLNHKLVVCGMIKVAKKIKEPDLVYIAISTGVLSRSLQLAWPNAKFISVAVARNLKEGELGRSDVISEPLPFQTSENINNMPPFPSVDSYDAKVWKYIPKNTDKDILFWNVGTEPVLQNKNLYKDINSYRDWNE